MKRVLVTGAGGFVGSHCVAALHDAGLSVTGLLGPGDSYRPDADRLVAGEIGDVSLIGELVRDADCIIHAAGPAAVAESFDDPVRFARVHTCGTATIADLARRAGTDRFILISSAEVYGAPTINPVAESAALAPISPYGAAKLGAEWQARTILGPSGGLTVVRPFSLYGPRMRAMSVMGRIIDAIAAGNAAELQTLSPVRDYLHIRDFATLIVRLIHAEVPPPVINACSGVGTSVGALARMALSAVCRSDDPVDLGATARPSDVAVLVGATDVARQLGWKPEMSLADGLKAMLQR